MEGEGLKNPPSSSKVFIKYVNTYVGLAYPPLLIQISSVHGNRQPDRCLNPRTNGGPGHLSTDGGADNRPPRDIENEAS